MSGAFAYLDRMSLLSLPAGLAPSNLHLRPSVRAKFVDGDVLGICERLAEISPRLYLVELSEDGRDRAAWTVMENCPDGVQRQVKKYHDLDQRMLADVQRMLSIPLEHRAAAAQADIDAANAKLDDDNIETRYEQLGHAFRRQLWHDGFIEHRGVSYPTRGVASRGRMGGGR